MRQRARDIKTRRAEQRVMNVSRTYGVWCMVLCAGTSFLAYAFELRTDVVFHSQTYMSLSTRPRAAAAAAAVASCPGDSPKEELQYVTYIISSFHRRVANFGL